MKDLLARQVTAPVRWEESVQCLAGLGVNAVVEVGAGNVLGGLVRRIAPRHRGARAPGIPVASRSLVANEDDVVNLEGKVALVTGGSRGIGRAIGVALGQRGAKVVLNYTSNEAAAAEAAAAVVAAGGAAVTKRFDVADPAAVDAAFKEVVAAEGGLHILVNNAGIAVNTLVLGAKDADWKRALDVNLNGTFYCCRAALRPLLKARDAGRIINITSITGETGSAGQAPYVAAKAGHHRPDEDAGARVRVARHHRQRGVARLHRHRHDGDRAARRTARRAAQDDSARARRKTRGRRRGGRLSGGAGCRLRHRASLARQRWTFHVRYAPPNFNNWIERTKSHGRRNRRKGQKDHHRAARGGP